MHRASFLLLAVCTKQYPIGGREKWSRFFFVGIFFSLSNLSAFSLRQPSFASCDLHMLIPKFLGIKPFDIGPVIWASFDSHSQHSSQDAATRQSNVGEHACFLFWTAWFDLISCHQSMISVRTSSVWHHLRRCQLKHLGRLWIYDNRVAFREI